MTVSVIPLQKLPDQTFFIEIDGKDCEIHLYLRYRNMFMDMTVDDKVLFKGVICRNGVNMLQYAYYGMDGELKFVDTQGEEDPYYSGFEDRWGLVYVQ